MKKTKFLLIFITLIFIHACGSFENVGKVMRNEKIRTTDEFLIEKRQPLLYLQNLVNSLNLAQKIITKILDQLMKF